ncbi:SNARE associated Golgi protein family isoform 1 [Hibiscus syriacus]|uniref:SNARE associated Golgi protein family isoform 1 n=1 Tax=Hibiscus syriacus TaxID=106335 RepID=A0A6A2Z6I7_HIBSY|nr:SNARE associated Golgi protein family isoform 1 [Hibiscus syriacus]
MTEKGGSFVPVHHGVLGLLTTLVLVGMVVVWSIDGCTIKANFTANLLSRWLAKGGEPCKDSETVGIKIPGLDQQKMVELSAGEIMILRFMESRPVVKDFGNGSYSVSIQVHPDFAGDYNLTVILLFRHFQGLKFSPARFVFDRQLRHIGIRFLGLKSLPQLQTCTKSDFNRDVWSGRWTRHGKNDDCRISDDGRYDAWHRIFHVGVHGGFSSGVTRIMSIDQEVLNFVLGLPEIKSVPRRFDMNFSNPEDRSQTVRITSIFNGHWNGTQNYLGLDSLKDAGFRNLVKKYFLGDTVPDTIIMNSGLHDGVHWLNVRAFSHGAEYAASFWKDIMESVRRKGLWCHKLCSGPQLQPAGMQDHLHSILTRWKHSMGVFREIEASRAGSSVIDNFDMTYSWHFDNRCNDGVHYGRAPLKMKWRDGEIGHQYFAGDGDGFRRRWPTKHNAKSSQQRWWEPPPRMDGVNLIPIGLVNRTQVLVEIVKLVQKRGLEGRQLFSVVLQSHLIMNIVELFRKQSWDNEYPEQKSMKELLPGGTILVGHSLHNDLQGMWLKVWFHFMAGPTAYQIPKDFLLWVDKDLGPWDPLVLAVAYIPLAVLAVPASVLTWSSSVVQGWCPALGTYHYLLVLLILDSDTIDGLSTFNFSKVFS